MTTRGSEDRFQVDLRGVMDLLSRHLYSSPRVFLRELTQNAVDAITARAALPDAPEPAIAVTTPAAHPDGLLTFHDNGVGLTTDEVHRLLATIGQSSKRDEFSFARTEFLGQFGIGLLSAFLVSDEVEVLSRSAREDHPTVRWLGRSHGTYAVEEVAADSPDALRAPGTLVRLRPRSDDAEWFTDEAVASILTAYAAHLPQPVHLTTASGTTLVTRVPHAWERDREQRAAYCRETFGFAPLDDFELSLPLAGLRGTAFVLGQPTGPRPGTHRVHLKGMLVSASVDSLLPDWAFFVRVVVDADGLRPTASREALYDDGLLAQTREALGDQVRDWLLRLAVASPTALERFLGIHHLAVLAMAQQDDEMLRLVRRHVPLETTLGPLTIEEYLRQEGRLRYTTTTDEFHALAAVAQAQGLPLVNGGYTYVKETLERVADASPGLVAETVDVQDLAARLAGVPEADELAARPLLRAAGEALAGHEVEVVLRDFEPAGLPALFLASPDLSADLIARDAEAGADELWAGVLGATGGRTSARPMLVLNHANPLARRLLALEDTALGAEVVGSLYVQALLQGRYPLRAETMGLLNSSLLGLVERVLSGRED